MFLKPRLNRNATEKLPTEKAEQPVEPHQTTARVSEQKATLSTSNAFSADRHESRIGTEQDREREECCYRIGQILRQIRQEKSLSIQGLHNRTYVPVHQIQALEEGRLENLPEDVYLRSFIRQLGNALGLNGVELAASLPISDAPLVPSWYHSNSSLDVSIPSAYLYFGYAAFLASSLGGLSWMSERSAYETLTERQQALLEQESDRANANTATASATAAVSPPEMLYD
ncbi:MAG: helix-turn-helix transcriptional regulator [Cyanobacteriota bacterium]|nr:helix-turn-helix transcriptional regulator [Cyanobacteriota bacterium]